MTVRNMSPATQRSYVSAVSKFSRYYRPLARQTDAGRRSRFPGPSCIDGYFVARLNQIACRPAFFLWHHARPGDGSRADPCTRGSRANYRLCRVPIRSCNFRSRLKSEEPRGSDDRLCGGASRLGGRRLRVEDVDGSRGVILVRHGKGAKDRNVMLSPQLLVLAARRAEDVSVPRPRWSASRCTRCAPASQRIFWRTELTFGSSKLLGHNNLSSTARYTQVATHTIRATQSPFDRLTLEVTPPGWAPVAGSGHGMPRRAPGRTSAGSLIPRRTWPHGTLKEVSA